jgi:hypothetical protein
MGKPRADSLWAKLTPAQRDEVFTLLAEQGSGYQAAVDMLAKWDVKTSVGAVARFYAVHCLGGRLERAKLLAYNNKHDPDTDKKTGEILAQKIFETVARADADPKILLALRRLEVDREKLRLAERRVVLLEAKLNEGREVISNNKLTPEQREARMKEILGIA